MTKIAGTVSVQLNTAEIKLGGRRYARAVVSELAKAVRVQAQHNVAPDVGPGPHPHKTWPGYPENIDTGNLMRSVKDEVVRETEYLAEAAVYTDLEYGKDLELSWLSHKGNRFMYKWLWPSSQAAVQGFSNVAKRFYHVLAGKLAI